MVGKELEQAIVTVEQDNRHLTLWMLIVSFAYYYKAIICGSTYLLGCKSICFTMIKGVSTNHWFEIFVYAPLMWVALYFINEEVFRSTQNSPLTSARKKFKFIGSLAVAIYLYGIGIHGANVIEILARVQHHMTSGPVYELIYFMDEQLSHWIQFSFFFFVLGWFIAHDRLDRTKGARIAVFIGIGHAVERAIGVIEGSAPYLVAPMGLWILLATLWRLKRFEFSFGRAFQDYFFRYGFCFCCTIPIAMLSYYLIFNGFVSPSEMGGKQWTVAIYNVSLVAIGVVAMLLFETFRDSRLFKNKG